MQKMEWSREKIQEIKTWKKQNKVTWGEAAKHFGVGLKSLNAAKSYYTGRNPYKKKAGKVSNPPARKYTKKPTYIDIQAAPASPIGNVTVVRCKLTELAAVLRGFE